MTEDSAETESSETESESGIRETSPNDVPSSESETSSEKSEKPEESVITYIVNTNTKRFHIDGCKSITQMKESNKKEITATRSELIDMGYVPCGNCNP